MSSRARRLRLFVALELPAEVCEELAGWTREALGDVAAELRGAAAVAPARSRSERRPRARSAPRVLAAESLHLTLCFLGSRPPAELPALSEALAAAADRCSLGSVSLGAPCGSRCER